MIEPAETALPGGKKYGSNINELTMLDYVKILWERKWFIIWTVFISSIISVIIALVLPKTYRASAVLMPPAQSQGSGILSSLSNLPIGGLISQSGDESLSFIAILKSRTVMEEIVNRYGLIDVYESKNIEEAVRVLRDNTVFVVEEEGTIRISTHVSTDWFHPDEQEEVARILAANMANDFVEQLDIVSKGLKTQKASFQRQFIEKRYNKNIEDLKVSEDSLKHFQEMHNMVALPEQTRVAIEAAATIKGQILANEVQLGIMATTFNPSYPELDRLRKETAGLENQLRLMDDGSANTQANSLFPIFSKIPDLGIQLMRLQRDVEIQNTLFTFLTQQYEEAKIQEAKDTPTVQVLDVAVAPIKKYKPQRMIIVLSIFFLSYLISCFTVIFKDGKTFGRK